MTPRPLCKLLIASCTPDGGVYRYHLCADGILRQAKRIALAQPMYLKKEGRLVHAILRAPFEGLPDSGIVTFDPETGEIFGSPLSTRGEVGCHLAARDGTLFAANYVSGSLFSSPDRLRVHKGHSTHPTRQQSPHVHGVFFSPDGAFLLASDLGLDRIFVYTRDLQPVSSATTPRGAGPRHLAFSKCGKYVYVLNEMGGSISVFAWNAPQLTLLKTVPILPKGHVGEGAGAAVKLSQDGTRLYATDRASNTIVTLDVKADRLTLLAHTDCRGDHPRDFTLLANDRFAVCSNQLSNDVALFQIDENGIPQFLSATPIEAPLCAIEI